MKAKIVVVGLLMSMLAIEVSAQGAEYDDMYFRGKDRERNKAIDAEEAISAKNKKQKSEEVTIREEEDNSNPTDSYSARNVNPEYVSRSNSEKASEDESNYYLEGYSPASTSSNSNFNNSYYNNANWAGSSYYANNSFNSPYYGNCACYDPWMSPYAGNYYNPVIGPSYGFGPSYGWRTGWSVSMMYGNLGNPYGGYGNPYYGGGYGNPYYGGGNYYNESPRVVNYGKRPSRHSAVVEPTQRTDTRTRNAISENVSNAVSTGRTRQRQTQDEYYVRPARRPIVNNGSSWSGSSSDNNWFTPSTQPTRTRDSGNSSRTFPPSYTPSSSPSSSPSRGSSNGSSGSGGSSSPRPRGRN